jgi:peptide/nickel transport system substrate-binding protein
MVVAICAVLFVAAYGAAGSSQAAGPSRGGVLHFARSLDVDQGLDPYRSYSNGSIFVMSQIFDQLVELGPGSTLQPGLATSWSRAKNGLSYTFHLRDARFSDGSPVTAEDVKFSVSRWANPKTNPSTGYLASTVRRVEIVDAHTIRVRLKKVDAPLLDYLSMVGASIVPEKLFTAAGKGFADHPVGSGAFKLKELIPGQRTVLERNPFYWRKGQPYLDGVEFDYVPDSGTRVLEMRSAQADVADQIPHNQVASLQETNGITVQVLKSVSWDSVFFNETKKPLQDRRIRQALNYATPKAEILKTVLYGQGQIANSNIPPLRYWDKSLAPYPYDIEKAKALMAQSSAPTGFKLDLVIVSGDAVEKQTAEIIKDEWGKIGVKVSILPRDFGTMFSDWLAGKGGEAATFPGDALSSDTLSDDEIAGLVFDPKAGLSSLGTFYDNSQVDKLLADAKGTIDDSRRAQDFAQIQQIGMRDVPAVPLFFTKSITAYRDKVQNFQTYPIGWWPLREVWMGS